MFAKVRVSRRKDTAFYPQQRDSTVALKPAGSHRKISTFETVLKKTDLTHGLTTIKAFTPVPGSPDPVTSSRAPIDRWHFTNTLKMHLYFSDN